MYSIIMFMIDVVRQMENIICSLSEKISTEHNFIYLSNKNAHLPLTIYLIVYRRKLYEFFFHAFVCEIFLLIPFKNIYMRLFD